jgi:serine/threonine protein kinase
MTESTVYRNALPLASRLLEFRLDSVLGAGAFGITYLAWDTHLEKHVAIKEYLPTELAVRALDGSVVPVTTEHDNNYQWGLERFLLEARTLARFGHPNIVRVARYFEANATGYMVMEYEKGESLAQFLRRAPQPDEARLRAVLMPLLDGLEAVHAAGFLHRDIKPANVFIRETGTPVLLDFGAARQAVGGATKSLTSVLTPGYAPLEQYSSDGHQGPWTDLYALAGVMFRAVMNENPPDAVARMREDGVPGKLAQARGRMGEAFIKAAVWALALDEKRRPQSVGEWRRALLGEAPVPSAARASVNSMPRPEGATVPPTLAGPTPVAESARAPVRPRQRTPEPRRSVWHWMVAAFLVVVIALAGIWSNREAEHEREAERAAAERGAAAQRRQAPPARESESSTAPPRERPREREPRPGEAEAEKLKRWAEADFRSADENSDGFLSTDEARNRFPLLVKEFQRVDADADGRISLQEFMRFRQWLMQQKGLK